MKTTDIIIRELTPEELTNRKPFSHFGWEGTGAFSFYVISDGYWESAKILLNKMIENANNFALVDSLIYPLFFNYRHSIEVFLKQLFFKYGETSALARKEFLEIGHDLCQLWAKLRPLLNQGKKHVGSAIDLYALEHYIKVLNNFDHDSMVMRYPIEKNLAANKSYEHKFDFINFGERMNELCDALRQLDYDLSNQITGMATLDELSGYLKYIEKYRSKINEFIALLEAETIEKNPRKIEFKDLDLFFKSSKTLQFLKTCEPDLLILLDNLFYGGRSVNENSIRLSKSLVERQKEFVKFCRELLEMEGLCFGKVPNDSQINIYSKAPSTILKNLSTAISILDLNEIA